MRSLRHGCPARSALAALCRRWGGRLVRVSAETYLDLCRLNHVSEAPFTSRLGVAWSDKKIYYTGDVHWAGVIHEMGHVFATKDRPDQATEYDFLGWEAVIARRFDFDAWATNNRDYVLGGEADWKSVGEIERPLLNKILRTLVKSAKQAGLIAKNGAPRAIR